MTEAFDINKFDNTKNYVITASAGTGKTYNIVEIVGKLIGSGTKLEEILIVTYTEKAAGELKDRIRKKLKDMSLEDVNVDAASIGTIHSFCQSAIDEFFISSKKRSNQTLIDEDDARAFLADFIRTGKIADEIALLKRALLNATRIDVDSAVQNLETEYASKPRRGRPPKFRANVITLIHELVNFSLDNKICNYLLSIINAYYLTSTNEEFKPIASLDCSILNEHIILFDLYDQFKENIYTRTADFLLNSDNKKTYSESQTASLLAKRIALNNAKDTYVQWQLEKRRRNERTYGDMLRDVREEVMSGGPLLEKLRQKYKYAIIDEFQDTNRIQWDVFKKVFLEDAGHHITVVGDPKQSIYSFQGADLTVFDKAREEIIANCGFERALTTNYRSTKGMIDSTNKFFCGDCGNISLGSYGEDGKQTYDFKGSEWREDSLLAVEYDGGETPAFWITEGKSEEKTVSPEEHAEIVCRTIVDCCSFVDENKTKLCLFDGDGQCRNVSFKDFAILARTRTEMEPVISALEKAGIPYQRYKDQSLFSGRECAHWIALLEAIDTKDFTGRNRKRFKNAMLTDFFGHSLSDLADPKYDKDSLAEIQLFDHWKVLVRENSWEELIDDVIEKSGICDRLGSLNDMKRLGAFKQIGEYCIDYLSKTPSISRLVSDLRRRQNKEKTDDDSENPDGIAKTTDFDCVKVMTIHASKGLEFPVVISVAGFKKPNVSSGIYSWHENGSRVLSLDKEQGYVREIMEENKRLFYVAYTRAKYLLILPHYGIKPENLEFVEKSILEYKTHNGYRSVTKDDEKPFEELSSDVSAILKHDVSATAPVTEEEQKTKLKVMVSQKKEHATKKHAYSSLTHGYTQAETMNDAGILRETVDEADEEAQIPPDYQEDGDGQTVAETRQSASVSAVADYDKKAVPVSCDYDANTDPISLSDSFPAGADLGQVLHDVFEVIDYTADYELDDNRSSLEAVIEDKFVEYGFTVKDEWTDDVVSIVKNVLGAKMPAISGSRTENNSFSLNRIACSDRKNELEFNFNLENESLKNYFNGFIDLIFRRGDRYAVLDWKSDRLNDIDFTSFSDAGILKNHVDEHYSIQRVLYSYCLIKWLKNFYPSASEQEIFERSFGGVYYVFLRGCNAGTGNGIYAQTWKSYADLKAAYDLIVSERVKKEVN